MARPPKFDYDSDDFYNEILALAIQGLTDAEYSTPHKADHKISRLSQFNMLCC